MHSIFVFNKVWCKFEEEINQFHAYGKKNDTIEVKLLSKRKWKKSQASKWIAAAAEAEALDVQIQNKNQFHDDK